VSNLMRVGVGLTSQSRTLSELRPYNTNTNNNTNRYRCDVDPEHPACAFSLPPLHQHHDVNLASPDCYPVFQYRPSTAAGTRGITERLRLLPTPSPSATWTSPTPLSNTASLLTHRPVLSRTRRSTETLTLPSTCGRVPRSMFSVAHESRILVFF
jgi:hypothetical protein